jgi:CTP synthase
VPLLFEDWGLGDLVVRLLRLESRVHPADLAAWRSLVERIKAPKPSLDIALVGKYIELPDAYLSVTESLDHAAWSQGHDVTVRWVDSEALGEADVETALADAAGIVVPGGFGHRGIEGKILAARYARERRVPYLGLCLGLQCGVIEFARHVIGERDANSTEFDLFTTAPVIDYMPDQRDMEEKGGTMRLGLYPARLAPGTKVHRAYGTELIYERHRHRFEVSNRYREALEAAGMILSGQSPDGRLVEIVELRDHPWYVASQFHPEFKSRPDRPHPLFAGFIEAAIERARPASAGGASVGPAQAPVHVHVDGGDGRGGRSAVPPAEVAEGT